MATEYKRTLLREVGRRYGQIKPLEGSQSLFDVGNGALRIYFRYSKIHHPRKRAFYGLREDDLRRLQGYPSVICFLWDDQREPLFIPFEEYEVVFQSVEPARDGQFKVQLVFGPESTELYLPQAGKFNIEGYFGWEPLERVIDKTKLNDIPELSHSQVQSLLGAVGDIKNFNVWIPPIDRPRLDFRLVRQFPCCDALPGMFDSVKDILCEVDVVWIARGSGQLSALFEVEHSTPIYSGLLRFNDIHLTAPRLQPNFSIVANEERGDLFLRQASRPTFKVSGLSDLCTFMKYDNVYAWYHRLRNAGDMTPP